MDQMNQQQLDGLTAGAMVKIVVTKADQAKLEALTIALLQALPQLGGLILESLQSTSDVHRSDDWDSVHKEIYDKTIARYIETVEIFSASDKT